MWPTFLQIWWNLSARSNHRCQHIMFFQRKVEKYSCTWEVFPTNKIWENFSKIILIRWQSIKKDKHKILKTCNNNDILDDNIILHLEDKQKLKFFVYAVITIPLQQYKSLGITLFGWGVLDYPIISPEPWSIYPEMTGSH